MVDSEGVGHTQRFTRAPTTPHHVEAVACALAGALTVLGFAGIGQASREERTQAAHGARKSRGRCSRYEPRHRRVSDGAPQLPASAETQRARQACRERGPASSCSPTPFTCVLAGRQTPNGYYNLERMLGAAARQGAEVRLWGPASTPARSARSNSSTAPAARRAHRLDGLGRTRSSLST
jgi:hypothetical protein